MFRSFFQEDIETMKLSYVQIMAKLNKRGFRIETRQARNIRYRVLKGLPFGSKDANPPDDPVEADKQLDELFNDELAREVQAGGRESVDALVNLHVALQKSRPGYVYDVSSDDLGRFDATCWMTARQRVRAARDGVLLFLDSSRSGISTVSSRCSEVASMMFSHFLSVSGQAGMALECRSE